MSMSNPIAGNGGANPPLSRQTWHTPALGNTLALGVQGGYHIQTLAFVGGNSPSPMQRLGLSPMNALGMLAPDMNEPDLAWGNRFPAQEFGGIWMPVLTANGVQVTQLRTSAR